MKQILPKHLLLMIVCCLVPLALILVTSVLGLSFGAFQSLIPFALVMMCPLMMLVMMWGMRHDHAASDAQPHQGNNR